MTLSQAQYFADNFRVIEQQETTSSGFSATLFQNIHTDDYSFTVRGSDDVSDWLGANMDNAYNKISSDQAVDMLNGVFSFAQRASSFSLLAQRKRTKRNDTLHTGPSGSLAYIKQIGSAPGHSPVPVRLKYTSCGFNPIYLTTLGQFEGEMAA